MAPVKLGIIGTGLAAQGLHLPALKKLKDKFTIAVVCNHTEDKAREFGKLAGKVPYVLDYRRVLEDPAVEAVLIALPIHLNYQAAKDSLAAGKHLLLEKPLAANLAEARSLVDFAAACSPVAMVAENYRFGRPFQEVKRLLDQGEAGRPYAVFCNSFSFMDRDNKYAKTAWRINHQYPGGFVTDGGVHYIAALRHWFGPIIPRSAVTQQTNPAIGKIDSLSLQFTASGGVSGIFNTYYSVNGYAERKFLILGTAGTIILEGNKLTLKRQGKKDQERIVKDDGGFQAEWEDFYGAIREGKKTLYPFSEGYADLEVIMKALELAGDRTQTGHG